MLLVYGLYFLYKVFLLTISDKSEKEDISDKELIEL